MSMLENVLPDDSTIWGKLDESSKRQLDYLKKEVSNSNSLIFTPFRDSDLVNAFFKSVIEEEQVNYLENTINYHLGLPCDYNFVIVTRRSVPSFIPKPEAFWSTDHVIVRLGLKNEIPPNSPARLHSVIMVSTIGKLANHGFDSTSNGSSDGELVIDPETPFNDFLFQYKPQNELNELYQYLQNGGLSLEEVLVQNRSNFEERINRQGFNK